MSAKGCESAFGVKPYRTLIFLPYTQPYALYASFYSHRFGEVHELLTRALAIIFLQHINTLNLQRILIMPFCLRLVEVYFEVADDVFGLRKVEFGIYLVEFFG